MVILFLIFNFFSILKTNFCLDIVNIELQIRWIKFKLIVVFVKKSKRKIKIFISNKYKTKFLLKIQLLEDFYILESFSLNYIEISSF